MKRILFTVILMFAAATYAKDEKIVSVSGDCLRTLVADRGGLTLVAEFVDASAGVASQKSMDQYNKIRDRVKKLNLKNLELETTEFSVNEEFDYNNNQRKSRGFRARMGLRATTSEINRLGELASIGSDLKVQNIAGLGTFVSTETLKSERENCLDEALKNARMKAERLAKASGQRLGPALLIQEDTFKPNPSPVQMEGRGMMMLAKADMASSSPTIEVGNMKMSVSVQVSFELL